MFSVRTHRRRPTRRTVLSFECLQARITPSDLTGMSDTLSSPTVTEDMWGSISTMTITDTTETSASMSTSIEIGTMTLPTTSC